MRPRHATASVLLMAVSLSTACICGSVDAYHGDYDGDALDPPKSLEGVDFIESEKGDPRVLGCADGQREGYADVERHPRIAGCLGAWDGVKSLREAPSGQGCGDDGEVCDSPADVCAEGWHVCGVDGLASDLQSHTTPAACEREAGPGKFVAGMSHGQTQDLCPPTPSPNTEFPCYKEGFCSEPVCCGEDCQFGKCRDAVWRGKTPISMGKQEGCGSVTSSRNGGILCCYDGEANPRDNLVAQESDAPIAGPVAETGTGTVAETGTETAPSTD